MPGRPVIEMSGLKNTHLASKYLSLLGIKTNRHMKKIYKILSATKHGTFALAFIVFWGTVASQTTYTFLYTGSTQTINLPVGNYSIACWGADGGTLAANTASAGQGGYSSGNIALSAPTTFTVYVGGKGNGGAQPLGGFNSGNGTTKTNTSTATGGGGASDVRVLVDDYFHRIIVAGGGGGQGTSSGTGGHGGGLTGQNGQGTTNFGVAGTQTAPGLYPPGGDAKAAAFGEGGDGPAGTTGGQGGGGWYGGSFGTRTNGGGAGGSGYVLTSTSYSPVGYFSANPNYYFTNTVTAMPGTTVFVTNPDLAGNGRVYITELCSFNLYAANNTNSLNPVICAGQSATLLTNAISNYSWSTGAISSSLVVSPTTNTVYALTATSPSNCTTSRSISVTVSSGLPVLSISNPSNNICLGQTATLTATGAISYTWTNSGVVNGQSFTPVSTAVYTVTGSNGCGTGTSTTTITVAPLSVTASSSPTVVCEGYTATLSALSAVNGYTWEPGTISNSVAVVTPTSSTIYTVTASDGICSGTRTVLVSTKTTPTIVIAPTVIAMCAGEIINITANGAGAGGSYSWTPGNATTASFTSSPSSSTVFTVYGTNSLNCTSSAQVPVIVNQPTPLNVSASSAVVCSGASVNLVASGSNSYSWTNGPNTANYLVNPTTALSVYTVTGFNTSNTCTATKTIAVSVIIPNVNVTSPVSLCDGGSATVTATGATTYTWNGIPMGANNVFVATPVQTTTYILVANTTSGSAVCPSTHSVIVNVNPNPTITITASHGVICKGESNTLTATGASSYIWQGTLGTGSAVVVKPNITTTYTLSGTDAAGCTTQTMVVAVVNTCNSIEKYNNKSLISIYPNPNNGQFFVSSESAITLNLTNTLGQIIRTVELNSENGFHVEVSGLAKGVYYLSSGTGLKQCAGGKLIVN
jgi:hypothetical protein